jgi:copper resistance protein B
MVRFALLLLVLPALARARDELPHPHAHDDALAWMLDVEELEWRQDGGAGDLHWDVVGWLGYDRNRLLLRDEGERPPGGPAENELELFWSHAATPWWDLLAGVRYDSGEEPSRAYLALGVSGLAPQWIHLEATGYFGDRGDVGLRLEADYEWLFTQRLALAGRAETSLWSADEERLERGAGESKATLGLRLRYELRREIAPYFGVEWERTLGDTADLDRAAGKSPRALRWVAGVGFWF